MVIHCMHMSAMIQHLPTAYMSQCTVTELQTYPTMVYWNLGARLHNSLLGARIQVCCSMAFLMTVSTILHA